MGQFQSMSLQRTMHAKYDRSQMTFYQCKILIYQNFYKFQKRYHHRSYLLDIQTWGTQLIFFLFSCLKLHLYLTEDSTTLLRIWSCLYLRRKIRGTMNMLTLGSFGFIFVARVQCIAASWYFFCLKNSLPAAFHSKGQLHHCMAYNQYLGIGYMMLKKHRLLGEVSTRPFLSFVLCLLSHGNPHTIYTQKY